MYRALHTKLRKEEGAHQLAPEFAALLSTAQRMQPPDKSCLPAIPVLRLPFPQYLTGPGPLLVTVFAEYYMLANDAVMTIMSTIRSE